MLTFFDGGASGYCSSFVYFGKGGGIFGELILLDKIATIFVNGCFLWFCFPGSED